MSGMIADEAAIGMINNKTTAVRVIPVPGKQVGDQVEFGGLFGTAPIMAVNDGMPVNLLIAAVVSRHQSIALRINPLLLNSQHRSIPDHRLIIFNKVLCNRIRKMSCPAHVLWRRKAFLIGGVIYS
ncbi:hypothetical protein AAULR_06399 [Lacticaseibacillus rhamnosus MTCC 5462]|nr:hypothetical protein AAULR_06399 [Lacticaseibacillus rhamnosus MTCC 5462]